MNTNNILISAIDQTLELLANCKPQDEYIEKFKSCKERLLTNIADKGARKDLYVLSAPKGYLGDGPLYPKQGATLRKDDIARVRLELVELIHGELEKDA